MHCHRGTAGIHMNSTSQSALNIKLRLLSRILTAGALVYGSLIVAGWLFGVPALKEPVPGEGAASAVSALAVILTGISLRLLGREPQPPGLRVEPTIYALGALAT